ncbi:MAG: hypothetical protein WC340_06310 [Kiritimatiellia bacterium]
MRDNTNSLQDRARRGSALLIVLGFLSFMMISAVAFAIYMRIERQASSNYRHAASARHILNSALYRAMDEVDSELRVTNIVNRGSTPRKFPNWPGRVRTSAVVNSADNEANARVLTLGALGYIPGILVNDVRYYAVPPTGPGVKGYLGAKWRPLSMPLLTMEGLNAYEEAVIGRYAYLCINVSDMLNVNYCKAQVRDGAENRVSIGHLFDEGKRDAFDERVKNDISYTTLQDFYACMFHMNDSSIFDSPWYDYLNTGRDEFYDAAKHILIADGVAMAEPPKADGFNVLDPAVPPLNIAQKNATLAPGFVKALNKAFANTSGTMQNNYVNDVLNNALADYLDEDSIPKKLDIPTVEMTPMISAISVFPALLFEIKLVDTGKTRPPPDNSKIIMSTLDLTEIDSMKTFPIKVKVVYPFKHSTFRDKKNFTLEVQAYLKIHYDSNISVRSYIGEAPVGQQNTGHYVLKLFSDPIDLTNDYPIDESNKVFEPERYVKVHDLNLSMKWLTPLALELIDDRGVSTTGFTEGNSISFSLVLSYAVIKSNGKCVDQVPFGEIPPEGAAKDEDVFIETTEKLYFKSNEPIATLERGVPVLPRPFEFAWACLETPDPRFNWKPSNWVRTANNNDEAKKEVNDSTIKMMGQDGRDADIFLSVSDAGQLQSPGELGFIVRPFEYNPKCKVDFQYDSYVADSPDFKNNSDYKAMFRTIRLYDHFDLDQPDRPAKPVYIVNHRRDDIFQYLTAGDPQKPLIGARVNPLSDIPLVLSAAIERVPFDYWVSLQITAELQKKNPDLSKHRDDNFNFLLGDVNWKTFIDGWIHGMKSVNADPDPAKNLPYNPDPDPSPAKINHSLNKSVRDKYGRYDLMRWYSSDKANRGKIFEPEVNLSPPLHEVDRKMLYSFSLDSFSDRQQLFLYIISAEATAPSLGDSVKSLAGGKAIALVWRDPYPKTDIDGKVVPWDTKYKEMYNDGARNNNRISPWYQHHQGHDDRSKELDYEDNSLQRSFDYHEQKILYFKYLDN